MTGSRSDIDDSASRMATRHRTMPGARLRLRLEHYESAARLVHERAVIGHHPMARRDVTGSTKRARRMNLRICLPKRSRRPTASGPFEWPPRSQSSDKRSLLKQWCARSHVVLADAMPSWVDEWLAERKLSRRIAVRVNDFGTVPHVGPAGSIDGIDTGVRLEGGLGTPGNEPVHIANNVFRCERFGMLMKVRSAV